MIRKSNKILPIFISETVVVNAEGQANPDLHSLAVDTDAQIVLKDADIFQVGKLFIIGRHQFI